MLAKSMLPDVAGITLDSHAIGRGATMHQRRADTSLDRSLLDLTNPMR